MDGASQRLEFSGRIEFLAPVAFVAESLEIEAQGSAASPRALTTRVTGRLAELRKCVAAVPAFAWMLDALAQEDGAREARLHLRATPEVLAALRAAGLAEDATPDDVLANEAWCAAAFDLAAYEGEGLGLVTRD